MTTPVFLQNKLLRSGLMAIIPLLILWNINVRVKSDFMLGWYDPEYCYLLNGLNIARTGGNIGHIDHPGTPVQVINAIIIRSTYIFSSSKNDLQTDVLLYPEYYLRRIAWIFTLVNCLILFWSGYLIVKMTENIGYGLVFQSLVLTSTVIQNGFYRDCPEPFLLGGSLILSVLFYRRYVLADRTILPGNLFIKYRRSEERSLWGLEPAVVIMAILTGFMLAVKIDALPLCFVPLFFLPGTRKKVTFLGMVFFAFIIFTLPAIQNYMQFLRWSKNLALHSDYYGNGPANIINPETAWNNFKFLFRELPIVVFLILFSPGYFILRFKTIPQPQRKFMGALIAIQLIDILLVVKHFRLHYLIPVIPTLALNLLLIFQTLRISVSFRYLLIIGVLAIFIRGNLRYGNFRGFKHRDVYTTDCINIYAYSCNSMFFALKTGDDYARKLNAARLEQLYGKQIFYNYWARILHGWRGKISADSLFRLNRTIYLYTHEGILHSTGTSFRLDSVSPGKYQVLPPQR